MALGSFQTGGARRFRPSADINVTPLVDVMLVLLIVFMITAPLLASGLKLDLPQATAARPLDPPKPIRVAVAKDGRILVGDEEVPLDRLAERLRAGAAADPATPIHLRGDRDAPFGAVVAVMDRLAANGFARIAIVTDATARTTPASAGSDAVVPPSDHRAGEAAP